LHSRFATDSDSEVVFRGTLDYDHDKFVVEAGADKYVRAERHRAAVEPLMPPTRRIMTLKCDADAVL